MSRFAVYRGLYGTDFLKYSIDSVRPYVDEVIFVYGMRPWGDVRDCTYRGKRYEFPARFDSMREMLADMKDVRVVDEYYASPRRQIEHITNDIVIPQFGKPDECVFMHASLVWEHGNLDRAFQQLHSYRLRYANTSQVEVWRGFDWRQHYRPGRAAAGLWDLSKIDRMPKTGLDSWAPGGEQVIVDVPVHNLRYAQNPNIMFWRQLVVMAHTQVTKDSKPNPDWFENKWLNWTPQTRDIEMALQWKHLVPKAVPYDVAKLPVAIGKDLEKLRKQTSNDAWKGYPVCV